MLRNQGREEWLETERTEMENALGTNNNGDPCVPLPPDPDEEEDL